MGILQDDPNIDEEKCNEVYGKLKFELEEEKLTGNERAFILTDLLLDDIINSCAIDKKWTDIPKALKRLEGIFEDCKEFIEGQNDTYHVVEAK